MKAGITNGLYPLKIQKTVFKKFITASVVMFATYFGGRFYYKVTDGFFLSNIQSESFYEGEIRPLLPQEEEHIHRILDQKFTYLGKGCQSYVFESEDKKYVIKFFKHQRFRLTPWLSALPNLPYLADYKAGKLEEKKLKQNRFFEGWRLAFNNLSDETGLVYVHLNDRQILKKQMTIYDKINRAHLIDLDQMHFLIQKKAVMLADYFLSLRNNKEHEKAVQFVDKLLMLLKREYAKGFGDLDPALMQNMGVIDGEPVHLDVGQFAKVEDPIFFEKDYQTKFTELKNWMHMHYPEIFDLINRQHAFEIF